MLDNTPSINKLVSGLTPRNTSKFLVHQTYNTDDSERTADNGYKFKVPEVWSSARSSNKSIAIRQIEWVPRIEFLNFKIVFENQNDKSRKEVEIKLVIPERSSITDSLDKVIEEFYKKNETGIPNLKLCVHYSEMVLTFYIEHTAKDDYNIKICDIKDVNKPSESFNRVFNQPMDMFLDFYQELDYYNVWNRCAPLHFHASFIPFDNYQYLGEIGDTWQNPIVYQDPNGSPLFNVWVTTDLKNRIPIRYETFIFRFSFIIDVEKYYE